MTHFRIDVQLPLEFNQEKDTAPQSAPKIFTRLLPLIRRHKKRKKIPESYFFDAYEKFHEIAGGVNTSFTPIFGSWTCPETGERYDDKSISFSVMIKSDNQILATKVKKIKELKKYKKTLLKRFNQKSIYMVATRCSWL